MVAVISGLLLLVTANVYVLHKLVSDAHKQYTTKQEQEKEDEANEIMKNKVIPTQKHSTPYHFIFDYIRPSLCSKMFDKILEE